jgi:hypothetical protein
VKFVVNIICHASGSSTAWPNGWKPRVAINRWYQVGLSRSTCQTVCITPRYTGGVKGKFKPRVSTCFVLVYSSTCTIWEKKYGGKIVEQQLKTVTASPLYCEVWL